VLKKFVKAAGFGIGARKREFTSCDLLNKLIARYEATCCAAATNFFHPTCLSSCHVLMQQEILYFRSLKGCFAVIRKQVQEIFYPSNIKKITDHIHRLFSVKPETTLFKEGKALQRLAYGLFHDP